MVGLPDRSAPRRVFEFRAAGRWSVPLVRRKRADYARALLELTANAEEGNP